MGVNNNHFEGLDSSEIVISKKTVEQAKEMGVEEFMKAFKEALMSRVADSGKKKRRTPKSPDVISDNEIATNVGRLRKFMPGDTVRVVILPDVKREAACDFPEEGKKGIVIGYSLIYIDTNEPLYRNRGLVTGSYIDASSPIVKLETGEVLTNPNFSYEIVNQTVANKRAKLLNSRKVTPVLSVNNYVGPQHLKQIIISN